MFFSARQKRIGNYRPGPGRPPGRRNNKTIQLEAAAREAAAGIDGRFEGDAHAFLVAIYQNPRLPVELRIMAATRALPVEKPVRSAVHESPHHGLADAVRAARKLAPPPGGLANSIRDQRFLFSGGGSTDDRGETSDVEKLR